MRPLVGSMSSSQQTRYHTSEQTKMFICFPSKCTISSFPTNRYKVRSSRLVQKVLYWITRQSSQLLVICYYDFYSLHYSLFTSGPNTEVIPFAAKSMLGPPMHGQSPTAFRWQSILLFHCCLNRQMQCFRKWNLALRT